MPVPIRVKESTTPEQLIILILHLLAVAGFFLTFCFAQIPCVPSAVATSPSRDDVYNVDAYPDSGVQCVGARFNCTSIDHSLCSRSYNLSRKPVDYDGKPRLSDMVERDCASTQFDIHPVLPESICDKLSFATGRHYTARIFLSRMSQELDCCWSLHLQLHSVLSKVRHNHFRYSKTD